MLVKGPLKEIMMAWYNSNRILFQNPYVVIQEIDLYVIADDVMSLPPYSDLRWANQYNFPIEPGSFLT